MTGARRPSTARHNALVEDGARAVWLRDEVVRLGALIDAPAGVLVGFDPHVEAGAPYIRIEPGGAYHWIVKERGQTLDHRTTKDPDDILFWSFEATTASMASRWAADNPDEERDSRVGTWAKQQELLTRLDPGWVRRWRHRLIAEIPGAEALLPVSRRT